jgi:NADH-quinone oxidoreductase subunit J
MDPVFTLTATISVGAALMTVTRRNPVYSAVWLLVCFLAFAVIFIKLSAPFLAAIHVLVYTGAILVLFLFVIMLLNLQPDEIAEEYSTRTKLGAAALCVVLFAFIAIPLGTDPAWSGPLPEVHVEFGGVAHVGRLLFKDYALVFELVSVLIMVAMFGAMVLAKKKLRYRIPLRRQFDNLPPPNILADHPYVPDPGPVDRAPAPKPPEEEM